MTAEFEARAWMKFVLWLGGGTHILLGLLTLSNPTFVLGWLGTEADGLVVPICQGVGLLAIFLGASCLFASRSPLQHPLFLVSIVSALISVMFVSLVAILGGNIPARIFWIGAVWGLAWTVPILMIWWCSIRSLHAVGSAFIESESDDPLRELRTNTGQSLSELSDDKVQMVVFLRHAGCTFCRQTLADIQAVRSEIQQNGCGIVFVHLGTEEDQESIEVFRKYGVDDLPRISDPTSRLYRQFGLDLGEFSQLFGPRVWLHGLLFGIVNGHGIGAVRGNSFQMPGVYLFHCGLILAGYRHERASDRPNYIELLRQVRTGTLPSASDSSDPVLV